MCKNILFSVIIPAYNASKTIKKTIRSVISSKEKNIEVIVVDDASQDVLQTEAIVNEYLKQNINIRIIKHESNKNGAAARNTGIKSAIGKYVAFLDSDDEWTSDKLSAVKEQIELSTKPQSTVFYSQVQVHIDGQYSGLRRPLIDIAESDMSEYLFLKGGFIQTSTIVCAKEVAETVLFNENFIRHQDYDFCLRAFHDNYEFKFIPKALSIYHVQGKVFKSKNEDSKFSDEWSNNMKKYMSSDGYWGYRLFLLGARYLKSGYYLKFIQNTLSSLYKLGIKGLLKSRNKLIFIIKTLLGQ